MPGKGHLKPGNDRVTSGVTDSHSCSRHQKKRQLHTTRMRLVLRLVLRGANTSSRQKRPPAYASTYRVEYILYSGTETCTAASV